MIYNLKLKKTSKGFTLVELLIVVGIIGILATLLMANFIGVRQRARDAQRKSDLRQIQSALELYRSDQGTYPDSLSYSCPESAPLTGGSPANTYMQKIPCDPSGASGYNGGRYYFISSGGITYTLGACLENTGDNSQGTTGTPPIGSPGGCSNNWYFVVFNP
jgi:general secretion pathway protein G